MSNKNVRFDASGRPGRHGDSGRAGHDGGTGQNGARGADAGRPTLGASGGSVHLLLCSAASDSGLAHNEVQVLTRVTVEAGNEQKSDRVLVADNFPQFEINARGGHGGNGANGGTGGDGGRGKPGRDATRERAGTDGGRGGDGGDGGIGSAGACGGDGGHVVVELDTRDSYLLMSVESSENPSHLVRPGRGGKCGHHGKGGRGGPGGIGGSAYRWTETDRDGNTRTHANPGGRVGPRGRDGYTPNALLANGLPGREGGFEIHVVCPEGRKIYPRRFDLTLIGFEFVEAPTDNHDGIFEFGEEVHVRNITVRNSGGMPTPAFQRIRLDLHVGQWVCPCEDSLFIEQSLEPDEEYVLPGILRFRVGRPASAPVGDPLIVEEDIRPRATQLGVEVAQEGGELTALFAKAYPNANLTRLLRARYPVENTKGVEALRSLAHGERTRIRFEVGNVSAKAIGIDSPRERAVGVQVAWQGGDVPAGAVIFQGVDGDDVVLTQSMHGFPGYFIELPRIDAHSSVQIEMQAGFRDNVEPYRCATLRLTIWIADFDDGGQWIEVQSRDLTLRLEPAFSYRPQSKVLLVSNNNTSREAFLAWYHVLEDSLGLLTDFWSLSRYGHFDHQVELTDGTNLRVQLEERLVVVLNQHFEPRASAESDLPTDYIRAHDFRESVTYNGTHYLIVGEPDFQMQQWLEPNSDFRQGGMDFPDIARFMEKEKRSAGTFVEEVFRDDITACYDVVGAHGWTLPFFQPSARLLPRLARKLQHRLAKLHPNRRYVVIYRPCDKCEQVGRIWGVFPRWKLGQFEVRRTLNVDKSEAVALEADDAEINHERFIDSDEVRYAVSLALPFGEKLNRLNWFMQQPDDESTGWVRSARALIQAIIVDLTAEQSAVRRSKASLNAEFFEQRFANLGRLIRYPFMTNIPVNSAKWEYFIELCAAIEAMTNLLDASWFFIGRRDRSITEYVLTKLSAFRAELFDRYAIDTFGDVAMDSNTAVEKISTRVEVLVDEVRRQYRALPVRERWHRRRHGVASEWFQHPQPLSERIARDIDCWLDSDARVWSATELMRAQDDESEREAKQKELRLLNAEVRSELLKTRSVSKDAVDVQQERLEVGTVEREYKEVVHSE